jgi:hypothetical protein
VARSELAVHGTDELVTALAAPQLTRLVDTALLAVQAPPHFRDQLVDLAFCRGQGWS